MKKATACDFPVCSDASRFGAPIARTLSNTLSSRIIALSPVTHKAVKESIRRIVVEQRLDDEDLIGEVYGSQAFRDGVAGFIGR